MRNHERNVRIHDDEQNVMFEGFEVIMEFYDLHANWDAPIGYLITTKSQGGT